MDGDDGNDMDQRLGAACGARMVGSDKGGREGERREAGTGGSEEKHARFCHPCTPPQQALDGKDVEQSTQPVPLVAVADPEADVGVAALVAAAGVDDPAEGPADGGAEGVGIGGVQGCGLQGLLGGIEARIA